MRYNKKDVKKGEDYGVKDHREGLTLDFNGLKL